MFLQRGRDRRKRVVKRAILERAQTLFVQQGPLAPRQRGEVARRPPDGPHPVAPRADIHLARVMDAQHQIRLVRGRQAGLSFGRDGLVAGQVGGFKTDVQHRPLPAAGLSRDPVGPQRRALQERVERRLVGRRQQRVEAERGAAGAQPFAPSFHRRTPRPERRDRRAAGIGGAGQRPPLAAQNPADGLIGRVGVAQFLGIAPTRALHVDPAQEGAVSVVGALTNGQVVFAQPLQRHRVVGRLEIDEDQRDLHCLRPVVEHRLEAERAFKVRCDARPEHLSPNAGAKIDPPTRLFAHRVANRGPGHEMRGAQSQHLAAVEGPFATAVRLPEPQSLDRLAHRDPLADDLLGGGIVPALDIVGMHHRRRHLTHERRLVAQREQVALGQLSRPLVFAIGAIVVELLDLGRGVERLALRVDPRNPHQERRADRHRRPQRAQRRLAETEILLQQNGLLHAISLARGRTVDGVRQVVQFEARRRGQRPKLRVGRVGLDRHAIGVQLDRIADRRPAGDRHLDQRMPVARQQRREELFLLRRFLPDHFAVQHARLAQRPGRGVCADRRAHGLAIRSDGPLFARRQIGPLQLQIRKRRARHAIHRQRRMVEKNQWVEIGRGDGPQSLPRHVRGQRDRPKGPIRRETGRVLLLFRRGIDAVRHNAPLVQQRVLGEGELQPRQQFPGCLPGGDVAHRARIDLGHPTVARLGDGEGAAPCDPLLFQRGREIRDRTTLPGGIDLKEPPRAQRHRQISAVPVQERFERKGRIGLARLPRVPGKAQPRPSAEARTRDRRERRRLIHPLPVAMDRTRHRPQIAVHEIGPNVDRLIGRDHVMFAGA